MKPIGNDDPSASASEIRRESLVDQTVKAMRNRIVAGQWTGVLDGEESLRTQFGISRVTLRKAIAQLAAQGWIATAGRGRRHVIKRRPNVAAHAKSATGAVRCLSPIPELTLVWSSRAIFDEIRKSLFTHGRRLEWEQYSASWQSNPAKRLERLTSESRADGWLLYRTSPEIQQWFQKNNIPAVVLGPCHEGVDLPRVQVDVGALARHAAGEASRLGHHHIAYVVFEPGVASSLATLAGLRRPAAKGQPMRKVTVISDDQTVPGLRNAIAAALAGEDPPTLFFVTGAAQAMPVLGILQEMKMRVPEDVSVIVRDHEPFLNRSVPELSRYTFDWVRLGRLAAKLVGECLEGAGRNASVRNLLPKFIPGATLARRRTD